MDIKEKEKLLREVIERRLPEFSFACKNTGAEGILLTQDAFAADLQTDEYMLLGMAIKYAGLFNKQVTIIGKK